jgi:hypothetical protein
VEECPRFRPRRSGNDGGVRGGPGGRSESASAPPGPLGSYDRPGSLVSAVSADQGGCRDGGVPSMCPTQRFTAVTNGQQRSTVGAADLLPARWRAGRQCFPSSRCPRWVVAAILPTFCPTDLYQVARPRIILHDLST